MFPRFAFMHVIKKKTLVDFWDRHSDAKAPLIAWFKEAKTAEWNEPRAIKERYRSMNFLAGNRVVFNIGGNKYRLIVKIAYTPGVVYIRFVGTHAEYDKIDAERI